MRTESRVLPGRDDARIDDHSAAILDQHLAGMVWHRHRFPPGTDRYVTSVAADGS
jgi:hypothetical protein